ncbi:MAG: hypothetical protein ACFFBD_05555 [Candidatus Hodarchaeota archaeon]
MKKLLIAKMCLIVLIFLFSLYPVQNTVASDWDYEENNDVIADGDWDGWVGTLSTGTVLTGYYETSVPTEGLDFFICDDANYNIFTGGGSATVYSLKENMHTAYFDYTLPYDDTWHLVFYNSGSTSVTVDRAADIDGDSTPYFSSASWDSVVNYQILENTQWYYFSQYCTEGSTIDCSFKTFFQTDGVDGFFCDSANYNTFSSGGTPTVWNEKSDYHIATLTTLTVPHADTWYVVLSAVGQADTVTIGAGVDFWIAPSSTPTTPTTTTPTTPTTTAPTTTAPTTTSGSIIPGFDGITLALGLISLVVATLVIKQGKKRKEL